MQSKCRTEEMLFLYWRGLDKTKKKQAGFSISSGRGFEKNHKLISASQYTREPRTCYLGLGDKP